MLVWLNCLSYSKGETILQFCLSSRWLQILSSGSATISRSRKWRDGGYICRTRRLSAVSGYDVCYLNRRDWCFSTDFPIRFDWIQPIQSKCVRCLIGHTGQSAVTSSRGLRDGVTVQYQNYEDAVLHAQIRDVPMTVVASIEATKKSARYF